MMNHNRIRPLLNINTDYKLLNIYDTKTQFIKHDYRNDKSHLGRDRQSLLIILI